MLTDICSRMSDNPRAQLTNAGIKITNINIHIFYFNIEMVELERSPRYGTAPVVPTPSQTINASVLQWV